MPRRARTLGLALMALLLASGCDEAAPSAEPSNDPAATTPDVACLGVPAGKCAEIVGEVQTNGSVVPAVAIQIRCSVAPCTEQQGQATVDLLYANVQRSSTAEG